MARHTPQHIIPSGRMLARTPTSQIRLAPAPMTFQVGSKLRCSCVCLPGINMKQTSQKHLHEGSCSPDAQLRYAQGVLPGEMSCLTLCFP